MSTLERYTTYDRLAWFYNRYWGREYHRQALMVLDKLLFPRLSEGARTLDLACGTGHLTRALADRGYRVTGLDGSVEMLQYARERVPSAEFVLADARAFDLPARFDAVVSTFEAMNHILSIEELETVFRNVYHALVQGGAFVFDMLTAEAYETQWGKSSATIEEDNVYIIGGGYDPVEKLGRAEITMFRLESAGGSLAREQWQRSDVTIYERCYSLEQTEWALGRSGFHDIQSHAGRDLGMWGDLGVGRMWFVAIK